MILYNITNRFRKYRHFKSRLDEYKYENYIIWKPSKYKVITLPTIDANIKSFKIVNTSDEPLIVKVPYEITSESTDQGLILNGTWEDIDKLT